jgi:hypothetical protein
MSGSSSNSGIVPMGEVLYPNANPAAIMRELDAISGLEDRVKHIKNNYPGLAALGFACAPEHDRPLMRRIQRLNSYIFNNAPRDRRFADLGIGFQPLCNFENVLQAIVIGSKLTPQGLEAVMASVRTPREGGRVLFIPYKRSSSSGAVISRHMELIVCPDTLSSQPYFADSVTHIEGIMDNPRFRYSQIGIPESHRPHTPNSSFEQGMVPVAANVSCGAPNVILCSESSEHAFANATHRSLRAAKGTDTPAPYVPVRMDSVKINAAALKRLNQIKAIIAAIGNAGDVPSLGRHCAPNNCMGFEIALFCHATGQKPDIANLPFHQAERALIKLVGEQGGKFYTPRSSGITRDDLFTDRNNCRRSADMATVLAEQQQIASQQGLSATRGSRASFKTQYEGLSNPPRAWRPVLLRIAHDSYDYLKSKHPGYSSPSGSSTR